MFSYLAFIHGGIETGCAGGQDSALSDGVELARKCIDKLKKLDEQHFPPKLLILLVSPTYLEGRRAAQLLEGVYSTFEEAGCRNLALIGTSVAAVFFDGAVHDKGALLVCLASRLLKVEVAVSSVVAGEPTEKPVSELLQQLELDSAAGEDPNPFANRALFTFLPGNTRSGYVASALHECLRERVWARVPIIGGVSSGFDGQRYLPAVQFANRQVYKDSLVAARVTSGTLIGMSANISLKPTKSIARVTGVEADGITLSGLDGKPVSEVVNSLHDEHNFFLFGRYTYNNDPFVEYPDNGGGYVRLLRKAEVGDTFSVLEVEPEKLADSVSDHIKRSCRSIGLINPVGCLGFRCSSYIRYRAQLNINLKDEIARVEEELQIPGGFVGGFVDGEAGKDQLGRSMLRSWSTAAAVFGDELRPRTVVHDGFFKVAEFFRSYPPLTGTPEQSVQALLDMIYDIGFPGVRLLLMLDDDGSRSLVVADDSYAVGTLGPPHGDTLPFTIKLSGSGLVPGEPAVQAARTGDNKFRPYNPTDRASTSYYFTPLKNSRHEVMGVLQIDLGREKELRGAEKRLLEKLSIIVGASLSRVSNTYEVQVRTQLQEALRRHLSAADTLEGVQNYLADAVKAVGLEMGHIRKYESYQLKLYAGGGPYYETAKNLRRDIPSHDVSPTMKAFRERHNIIVNDALNNADNAALIAQYSDDPSEDGRRLHKLLSQVGSYANIYFESESKWGIKGTINLVSDQRWFFKHPQTHVLRKIAEHVEFLINRLEQKGAEARATRDKDQALADADRQRKEADAARAEAEQTNQRLRFVVDATPQIANQNLDNFRDTLTGILSLFCEKALADVGSLYLWDQDRELYVLRAAYGWVKSKDWVDAAAYRKDDGWFGARDLTEPRHFPNLNRHYESIGDRPPENARSRRGGSYAEFMFGEPLSANFQVEVIGIPLSVGHGNEIGVLALYNRTWSGKKSGFLQTVINAIQNDADRPLITGAAYEIAGLIGALVQRHDDKTEAAELERRKKISDALSNYIERESDSADETFESLVCREVAEAYGATSAKLYGVESPQGEVGLKLIHKASYPPEEDGGSPVAFTPDSDVRPALDDYAVKVSGEGIKADDLYVKRKSYSPEEREDPYKAATEGLVERVCLPLLGGREQLTEVLDLRWEASERQSYEEESHFRKKYLWQLSDDLSMFSRLHKQTVKRIEAEKIQNLFMGKVGAMAQAAHTWKDQLRDIFFQEPGEGQDAPASPKERVDYLEGELQFFQKEMEELLLLTQTTDLAPRPFPLLSLIELKEEGPGGEKFIVSKRLKESNKIKCEVHIPEELMVNVTPGLLRFAFENVIDNAIKVTRHTADGYLTITVAEGPTPKFVQVTFCNNGKKIPDDTVAAVNNNNFKTLGMSWGLMIAKCFALCHGGDLVIQSRPEGVTTTIFTLPVVQ